MQLMMIRYKNIPRYIPVKIIIVQNDANRIVSAIIQLVSSAIIVQRQYILYYEPIVMEFYFVQIVIFLFLSLHLNIVSIHIIIFQELTF